jgi:hypothetical protein
MTWNPLLNLYIYEDLSSIKEDSKHKPLKTDISTYKERSQFHTGTLIGAHRGALVKSFPGLKKTSITATAMAGDTPNDNQATALQQAIDEIRRLQSKVAKIQKRTRKRE